MRVYDLLIVLIKQGTKAINTANVYQISITLRRMIRKSFHIWYLLYKAFAEP